MKKLILNKKTYNQKYFSILGDSLSTLDGFNPEGYNVFYKDEKCQLSGVRDIDDTWWGMAINHFGGKLLVNNSWSGSRVTKYPNRREIFPAGCSFERTGELHHNKIYPDVIIVYLGTNDWAYNVKPEEGFTFLTPDLQAQTFCEAYTLMLQNLKSNYPDSEIWCCALCETYMESNPSFVFPGTHTGNNQETYNEFIRELSNQYGCKLIDLHKCNTPYDTIDGLHPTVNGMRTIANMVIDLADHNNI